MEDGHVGKQLVAGKEYCTKHWLKKMRKIMDRCIGHGNVTEIMLKKALNTIQPIGSNQNFFGWIILCSLVQNRADF